MRIDAVKRQRFRLQVGALERLHVEVQGLVPLQPAIFIHFQRHGGDLQQRIGIGVEAGGFNIYYYGIKPTKTTTQGVKITFSAISFLSSSNAARIMANFAPGCRRYRAENQQGASAP